MTFAQTIDPEKLERVAEVLKTIAHPTRLCIIEQLQYGQEKAVSEIQDALDVEQSALSHHLIKMKDKGVLATRREGKNIYYRLCDTHITSIFDCMNNCSFL
jgi:DNA-binding transcriptional ArsR family regulator